MGLSVIVERVSEEQVRIVVWNGQRSLAVLDLLELPTETSRFDVKLELARGPRPSKLLREFATNGVDYGAKPHRRPRQELH